MTPSYKIAVNGTDATASFAGRLIDLRVTDEVDVVSAGCTIVIEDVTDKIAVPARDAVIEVFLGYDGNVSSVGKFCVDQADAEGPPDRIIIRATAMPLTKTSEFTQFQIVKNRSFDGYTVTQLVQQLASEHGLTAAVDAEFSRISLPHLDQTDESDAHFLVRVSRMYNALCKPDSGKLVWALRDKALSIGTSQNLQYTLTPKQVTRWRCQLMQRTAFTTVITTWIDPANGTTHDVQAAGSIADVPFRVKTPFPDQATAQQAANGILAAFQRQTGEFSITLPGDVQYIAGGKLTLSGFRPGADGEWIIWRVEHSLSRSGLVTQLSGQAPAST